VEDAKADGRSEVAVVGGEVAAVWAQRLDRGL